MASVLAQAVITKFHRLEGLNNTRYFLTVLEAGNPSKVQLHIGSILGEDCPPGLQVAAFSVCPHMVETGQAPTFSSYQRVNAIRGPTFSKPADVLKDPPPDMWGVRAST